MMPEITLERPGRAHLVGICGAGMKAVAELLSARGWVISGCDSDPDPGLARLLNRSGIAVISGHAAQHLSADLDLLIHSPAVSRNHPELQAASSAGIPVISSIAVLADQLQRGRGIAIAGTHGKSTTTALLGHLLEAAGRDPTVLCGAVHRESGRSGRAGSGPDVVVEACEYRRHFLQLAPERIVLLGIEADHFDCYPTLAEAEAAYREFVLRVPETGCVLYRSDCPVSQRVVSQSRAKTVSFSLEDPEACWSAEAIRAAGQTTCFRLLRGNGQKAPQAGPQAGENACDVQLPLPGRHNVLNALAAAACAWECGLSLSEIASGLESFQGLQRRFEVLSTGHETVIDDYAHHPTEIRATLSTAREAYPGSLLDVVFQPHQLSRTRALLDEFAAALAMADSVRLLPVYAAREQFSVEHAEISRELAKRTTARGVPATFLTTLDRLRGTGETGGSNRVILTLGAGDLTRRHYEFTERLPRNHETG